jgi:hypothetical protein
MVLVVNAEVHPKPAFSLTRAAPSLTGMISAVSIVQIYRYNFETLDLLRESLKHWADEIPPDVHGCRVRPVRHPNGDARPPDCAGTDRHTPYLVYPGPSEGRVRK